VEQNLDEQAALEKVLSTLSKQERDEVIALTEDSSYQEPRVLSHVVEQ
jgi:hypothetical protein